MGEREVRVNSPRGGSQSGAIMRPTIETKATDTPQKFPSANLGNSKNLENLKRNILLPQNFTLKLIKRINEEVIFETCCYDKLCPWLIHCAIFEDFQYLPWT